jgi:hypothetical protein
MKTQTSLAASQFRLQQWAEQVRACQNRPYGMKVDTWCAENGISKANYYYRLRQVRQACLNAAGDSITSFVEVPVSAAEAAPEPLPAPTDTVSSQSTAAILHGSNGITIEILAGATTDFIHALLEAMAYVK